MKICHHIRLFTIKFIRVYLHAIYLVPIQKNKIVFMSFGGEQISCNPLYIYKKIKDKHSDLFTIYWIFNSIKFKNEIEEKTVKYGSWQFIYHTLTASCVVTNDTLPTYLPFRKSQLVINTWHGGGLFKQTYGNSTESEKEYNSKVNDIHNADTSLYTSSGKAWSEQVVKLRFGYNGKILASGMARNDIFFYDVSDIVRKVKSAFNIPESDAIVLYAPTFRGSATKATLGALDSNPIDVTALLAKLNEKYNRKFHFLFRGHHTLSTVMAGCLNASDYPDMQELLASADVFLSDFSSCLWDYTFTYRPCFIYAPDFDTYAIKPGFESDYKHWPFPIAKNNNELLSQIECFDLGKFRHAAETYHTEYGSYESGKASQQISEYICDKLKIGVQENSKN